jgi:hypothetical protein
MYFKKAIVSFINYLPFESQTKNFAESGMYLCNGRFTSLPDRFQAGIYFFTRITVYSPGKKIPSQKECLTENYFQYLNSTFLSLSSGTNATNRFANDFYLAFEWYVPVHLN